MYARHETALFELTQSVLANTELSTIMPQAVTLVAGTLAVAHSAIWELLPDHGTLVLRCAVGWSDAALASTMIEAAPTSLVGASVLGTSPVIVANWPGETRYNQAPLLRDHGVISSLAVVIPGQARPFGSLSVDVEASRMFSDEEISFLQTVANVLALAIERFQANQMIVQQVDQRTRAIEERLVAGVQDRAVLEERQRLARELHDSVTQTLYSVTLHAEGTRRLLEVGNLTSAVSTLRALQETAQEALDEMRLLIFELRPPILTQVGLEAALQARLNAVEGRANLQTQLIVQGNGTLPEPVEQALYRIAQEGLNNVLKHAAAQRVTVSILLGRSVVTLDVVDDGIGFDPAVANGHGGLGLRGIAERVAQLGGHIKVQSAPGTGTQLRVEIAL